MKYWIFRCSKNEVEEIECKEMKGARLLMGLRHIRNYTLVFSNNDHIKIFHCKDVQVIQPDFDNDINQGILWGVEFDK